MSERLTVADVIARAGNLIPNARAASPSRLSTHAAWVLTDPATLPEPFRAAQEARTIVYLATGSRTEPGHAVAYWVTSYGTPIAWVTLDGRTHYADDVDCLPFTRQHSTVIRHRDAIRAVWPERFLVDSQGVTSRPVPAFAEGDAVIYRANGDGPAEPGRIDEVITDPKRQAHVEGQYDVALDDGQFVFAYTSELQPSSPEPV